MAHGTNRTPMPVQPFTFCKCSASTSFQILFSYFVLSVDLSKNTFELEVLNV